MAFRKDLDSRVSRTRTLRKGYVQQCMHSKTIVNSVCYAYEQHLIKFVTSVSYMCLLLLNRNSPPR